MGALFWAPFLWYRKWEEGVRLIEYKGYNTFI